MQMLNVEHLILWSNRILISCVTFTDAKSKRHQAITRKYFIRCLIPGEKLSCKHVMREVLEYGNILIAMLKLNVYANCLNTSYNLKG